MLCDQVGADRRIVHRSENFFFSGESGSGKTESTKLFLKQLMYLCGGSSQLEQQILQVKEHGFVERKVISLFSRQGHAIVGKFWQCPNRDE